LKKRSGADKHISEMTQLTQKEKIDEKGNLEAEKVEEQ
jgi:hypothetical protein